MNVDKVFNCYCLKSKNDTQTGKKIAEIFFSKYKKYFKT